jgi:steroid 5-alpha reductase family enzyme
MSAGRGLATVSRPVAFAVVTGSYLLAAVVAVAVYAAVDGHPLVRTLLADIAATLVVFILSTVVDNASLYDPYWSVAPPVILCGWWAIGLTDGGLVLRKVIVVGLVLAWAVRLTANWAVGWRGLSHEDWRYQMLRGQTHGLPWWVVNLTGIQLMPTLVVYIGLLSAWPTLTGTRAFGPLDVLAIVVTVASIALEAVSDVQLRRFTADPSHRGQVADVGLWRYSRHPNYLGEIGFWCGLFLFGLAAAPTWWWTIAGPVVMVVLFTAVSVPMMDRRSLQRRPAYAEYAARVPALVPLPRRG